MANFPSMDEIGTSIATRLNNLEKPQAEAKVGAVGSAATASFAKQSNGILKLSISVPATDTSALVKKSGDRGALSGFETVGSTASAVTINASSADDIVVTGAVAITVSDGAAGQTWQKNVAITNAGATVAPGSKWKWANNKTPEMKANSLLVCKWMGVFGILSLVVTE